MQPLPTELAGTTVTFLDARGATLQAQLLYVSPQQVNFVVPADLVRGPAVMTVINADGGISRGAVAISDTAAGLFSANSDGSGVAAAYVLRVKPDNSQSYEPVAIFDESLKAFVPLPIDFGPPGDKLYLVLFGTGIRNRSTFSFFQLTIGGHFPNVLFAGAQGFYAGLDQINAELSPFLTGSGDVDVVLEVEGFRSNVVRIRIK